MKPAARLAPWLCALALALASGCVGNRYVKTPRYTLTMPDFWQVKSEGLADGAPTTIIIGRYGSAVIDSGSGSMEALNYEAVQADVQVWIYAWPAPPAVGDPSLMVAQRLARVDELQLPRHLNIPDQPPECGLLKRKYDLLKTPQEPLDLVSRPGWRTIVLGGLGEGTLLGIVARVEYEQDVNRYCHNLSNMRVQLQNLLDGLTVMPAPPAAPPPAIPGTAATPEPSKS